MQARLSAKRLKPVKRPSTAYCQLWRVVDGAVKDALTHHPEYIADGIRLSDVRGSINKRVTGAVLGFAHECAEGRSGINPAAEKESAWDSTGRFMARCGHHAARWAGRALRRAARFLSLKAITPEQAGRGS